MGTMKTQRYIEMTHSFTIGQEVIVTRTGEAGIYKGRDIAYRCIVELFETDNPVSEKLTDIVAS